MSGTDTLYAATYNASTGLCAVLAGIDALGNTWKARLAAVQARVVAAGYSTPSDDNEVFQALKLALLQNQGNT